MDHIIYVNGTANPEQITSDDLQDMRTDSKFVVDKFKGQQDVVKDLTLPNNFTAKFVGDDTTPYLYARHYRVTFQVPEYPDEEMYLLLSLIKCIVSPKVFAHLRFTEESVSTETEEYTANGEMDREMTEGTPRFIRKHLGLKVHELFSFLTDDQVDSVVTVMQSQLHNRTAVGDVAFLGLLQHVGIPEDTAVDVFNTMLEDVSIALQGLGIDILEPDACVNWNC